MPRLKQKNLDQCFNCDSAPTQLIRPPSGVKVLVLFYDYNECNDWMQQYSGISLALTSTIYASNKNVVIIATIFFTNMNAIQGWGEGDFRTVTIHC